jgi:polyisoprenoid-binding protein YceI
VECARTSLTAASLILLLSAAVFGQSDSGKITGSLDSQAAPTDGMIPFYIADPNQGNTATFKSKAPLEDIVGTSNEIEGTLYFNPQNPQAGGSGHIRVPIASLETGIPLRNEHLQSEDWLNAGKFPYIEFEITEVKDIKEVQSDAGSGSYDVTVVGDFSVHGKSKTLEVPARITYLKESEQTRQRLPGDLLAARTEFTIVLADFDIKGPSSKRLIGSKVGKKISIEVTVVASTVNPSLLTGP